MENTEKLKNIYFMDRAIRALNNEDALYYSGWLSCGVADGDTDNGLHHFLAIGEIYLEDYDYLYKAYKKIMKDYKEDGILKLSKKWAFIGADEEVLNFVKKDFKDIKIID